MRQATQHWYEFLIETFGMNTLLMTWDYANRNDMVGRSKSTCERDLKTGCVVALVLYSSTVRADAEPEAAGTLR